MSHKDHDYSPFSAGAFFSASAIYASSEIWKDRKKWYKIAKYYLAPGVAKARERILDIAYNRLKFIGDMAKSERASRSLPPEKPPIVDAYKIVNGPTFQKTEYQDCLNGILKEKKFIEHHIQDIVKKIEGKYSYLYSYLTPSEYNRSKYVSTVTMLDYKKYEGILARLKHYTLYLFNTETIYQRTAEIAIEKLKHLDCDVPYTPEELIKTINYQIDSNLSGKLDYKQMESSTLLEEYYNEIKQAKNKLVRLITDVKQALTKHKIDTVTKEIETAFDSYFPHSKDQILKTPTLGNNPFFGEGIEILNVNAGSEKMNKLVEATLDVTKPIPDNRAEFVIDKASRRGVTPYNIRSLVGDINVITGIPSIMTAKDQRESFSRVIKETIGAFSVFGKEKGNSVTNLRVTAISRDFESKKWSQIESTWFDISATIICKDNTPKTVNLRLHIPFGMTLDTQTTQRKMIIRQTALEENEAMETLKRTRDGIYGLLNNIREYPNQTESLISSFERKINMIHKTYGTNNFMSDVKTSLIITQPSRLMARNETEAALFEFQRFEALKESGNLFAHIDTEYANDDIYEMTVRIVDHKVDEGVGMLMDSVTYFVPTPGHNPPNTIHKQQVTRDQLKKIVADLYEKRTIEINGRTSTNLCIITHSFKIGEGKVFTKLLDTGSEKLSHLLGTRDAMSISIDAGIIQRLSPYWQKQYRGDEIPQIINGMLAGINDIGEKEKLKILIDKLLVREGIPPAEWHRQNGLLWKVTMAHGSLPDTTAMQIFIGVLSHVAKIKSGTTKSSILDVMMGKTIKEKLGGTWLGLSIPLQAKGSETLQRLSRIIPNYIAWDKSRPIRMSNGMLTGRFVSDSGVGHIETLGAIKRNLIPIVKYGGKLMADDPYYSNPDIGAMNIRTFYTGDVLGDGAGKAYLDPDLLTYYDETVTVHADSIDPEIYRDGKIMKWNLDNSAPVKVGRLNNQDVFTKNYNVGSMRPDKIQISEITPWGPGGCMLTVKYKVAYKFRSGKAKFGNFLSNIMPQIFDAKIGGLAAHEVGAMVINQNIYKYGEGWAINGLLDNLARQVNMTGSLEKKNLMIANIKRGIKKYLSPDAGDGFDDYYKTVSGDVDNKGLGIHVGHKGDRFILGIPMEDYVDSDRYIKASEYNRSLNRKLTFNNILKLYKEVNFTMFDIVGDKLDNATLNDFINMVHQYRLNLAGMSSTGRIVKGKTISELGQMVNDQPHVRILNEIISDYKNIESIRSGKITPTTKWLAESLRTGKLDPFAKLCIRELMGDKKTTAGSIVPGLGDDSMLGIIGMHELPDAAGNKKLQFGFVMNLATVQANLYSLMGLGKGIINRNLTSLTHLLTQFSDLRTSGPLFKKIFNEMIASKIGLFGNFKLSREISTMSNEELTKNGWMSMLGEHLYMTTKAADIEFSNSLNKFSDAVPIRGRVDDVFVDTDTGEYYKEGTIHEKFKNQIDIDERIGDGRLVKIEGAGRTYRTQDVIGMRDYLKSNTKFYIPLSDLDVGANVRGTVIEKVPRVAVVNQNTNNLMYIIGDRAILGDELSVTKQSLDLRTLLKQKNIKAHASNLITEKKDALMQELSRLFSNRLVINKQLRGQFEGNTYRIAVPDAGVFEKRHWNNDWNPAGKLNLNIIGNDGYMNMERVNELLLKFSMDTFYINSDEAAEIFKKLDYNTILQYNKAAFSKVLGGPEYLQGPDGPRFEILKQMRLIAHRSNSGGITGVDKFVDMRRLKGQTQPIIPTGPMDDLTIDPYRLLDDLRNDNIINVAKHFGIDSKDTSTIEHNVRSITTFLAKEGYFPSALMTRTKYPDVEQAKNPSAFVYGSKEVQHNDMFWVPMHELEHATDRDADQAQTDILLSPEAIKHFIEKREKGRGFEHLKNKTIKIDSGLTTWEYNPYYNITTRSGEGITLASSIEEMTKTFKGMAAPQLSETANKYANLISKDLVRFLNPIGEKTSHQLLMLLKGSNNPASVEVSRLFLEVFADMQERQLSIKGGLREEFMDAHSGKAITGDFNEYYNALSDEERGKLAEKLLMGRQKATTALGNLSRGAKNIDYSEIESSLRADSVTRKFIMGVYNPDLDLKTASSTDIKINEFCKYWGESPEIQEVLKDLLPTERTVYNFYKRKSGSVYKRKYSTNILRNFTEILNTKKNDMYADSYADRYAELVESGEITGGSESFMTYIQSMGELSTIMMNETTSNLWRGKNNSNLLKEVDNLIGKKAVSNFMQKSKLGWPIKLLGTTLLANYFFNPGQSGFLGHMPGEGGEEYDWTWSTNEKRMMNDIGDNINLYDTHKLRFRMDKPQEYLKLMKNKRTMVKMGFDFDSDQSESGLSINRNSYTYNY